MLIAIYRSRLALTLCSFNVIIFLFHEYASVTESSTVLFDEELSHKCSVRSAKKELRKNLC